MSDSFAGFVGGPTIANPEDLDDLVNPDDLAGSAQATPSMFMEEESPYDLPPIDPLTQTLTALSISVDIIGGGLLYVPLAIHQASILWGTLLVCAVGAGAAVMSSVVVKGWVIAEATNLADAFSVVVLGPALLESAAFERERNKNRRLLSEIAEVSVFLYHLSLLVLYITFTARLLADIAKGVGAAEPWCVEYRYYAVIFMIVFFLLCHRRIEEFKLATAIAAVTVTVLPICMLYKFWFAYSATGRLAQTNVEWKHDLLGEGTAVAILNIALSFQHNAPSMYWAMETPTPKRFKYAVRVGTCLSTIIFLIVGVVGYLTVGHAVEDDNAVGSVINNYPVNDDVMLMARVCLVAYFVCAFKGTGLAVRDSLHRSVLRATGHDDIADHRNMILLVHRSTLAMEAVLIAAVSTVCAMGVSDTATLIVGNLCMVFGVVLIFVFPGLMGYAIHSGMWHSCRGARHRMRDVGEKLPHENREQWTSTLYLVVAGVGMVLAVAGVFTSYVPPDLFVEPPVKKPNQKGLSTKA